MPDEFQFVRIFPQTSYIFYCHNYVFILKLFLLLIIPVPILQNEVRNVGYIFVVGKKKIELKNVTVIFG